MLTSKDIPRNVMFTIEGTALSVAGLEVSTINPSFWVDDQQMQRVAETNYIWIARWVSDGAFGRGIHFKAAADFDVLSKAIAAESASTT